MRRVGKLSALLSRELDPKNESTNWLAGLYHDIGKAQISPDPVEILTYKGSLSKNHGDWWKEVLQHPIYSVEMLEQYLPEIALITAEIVRHHHENHLGTGYPDRLSSKKIPLGASILSVADTFDARTVGGRFRSYGEPVSPLEAVRDMKNGGKYDSSTVEALEKLCAENSGRKQINKIYRRTALRL